MKFRIENKEYTGATATEIVGGLARDAAGFTARGSNLIREFLQWSLENLSDRLPERELALSSRMNDESLAFNYLSMCGEYGIGEFFK